MSHTFFAASLLLAATPGPGLLYILARTIAQGRSAGLCSVAGVALGNLSSAIATSAGLAAVLSAWPPAFATLRYGGALYLAGLAISTLRNRGSSPTHIPLPAGPSTIVRDGWVVAALNPKTALFFTAFLPQFVDPEASPLLQGALLGLLFVLIALITDCLYVLAASPVWRALASNPGIQRRARHLGAGVLIGLALLATVADGPAEAPAPRIPSGAPVRVPG
ncbi:LysE family translocator [Accumulibacter sp.]|uniref:LysE family translocator n=1 Tax=Accumulibacter sp. TaxID=2053492 RepID=UPI0025FAE97F|nr:LysE family translocator [Accumulibacter sp.]MCM8595669.1 LysE family translocator [Accumulibacter sp.]MCM8627771.1 LysE family translocator [Accumulibacter sp.]MDS4049816.1 LysE family translocator [Accumulibacter sp.]